MAATIPAGAMAPAGYHLGRLMPSTGLRLHIGEGDTYVEASCGVGIIETVSTAGPGYNLCPDCSKATGVKRADLPIDAVEAGYWRRHAETTS